LAATSLLPLILFPLLSVNSAQGTAGNYFNGKFVMPHIWFALPLQRTLEHARRTHAHIRSAFASTTHIPYRRHRIPALRWLPGRYLHGKVVSPHLPILLHQSSSPPPLRVHLHCSIITSGLTVPFLHIGTCILELP
jgi:hypothetical protein